jgi:acyl carrier protein
VNEEAIKQRLRDYVVQSAGLAVCPGDDDQLIDKGFIPSVRLLDLVGFLEDSFSIRLRPVDLVPEKLASVAQIARVVHGRLTSKR